MKTDTVVLSVDTIKKEFTKFNFSTGLPSPVSLDEAICITNFLSAINKPQLDYSELEKEYWASLNG